MRMMSNTKKWIRVACRLCGKEMLFPKGIYKEKDFIGWECKGALSMKCKIAYERMKKYERI